MSANRERNFGRPSLENPLSSRSRHYVVVRDKDGKSILRGHSAVIKDKIVIVDVGGGGSDKRAFSLDNVTVEGNLIGFAEEKKP